jgi:hypothetical protein
LEEVLEYFRAQQRMILNTLERGKEFSKSVFSEIRGSVDSLGRAILYASLKLKHTVGDARPASSHQHCGRDIHKSQDYDQDQHEAGKLLRLSTAIP